MRVVEKVEAKIKDTTADGLAIDQEVRLVKVPPSCPNDEGRNFGVELIGFSVGPFEADLTTNSVVEIYLTIKIINPRRSVRVLIVGTIG